MNGLEDKQYSNSAKFNARVLIHSKYGINKTPWPIWLFNQYDIPENAHIIEFGCGNGLIWMANSFRINPSWNIVLSDISKGMIESAKEAIKINTNNITYEVIDLTDYIVKPEEFDRVIANHMLYHIENRNEAIEKIHAILKPDGIFYSSTIGQNNMIEMKELINEFTGTDNYSQVLGNISDRFSLENEKEQLEKYFSKVEKSEYIDSLEITDTMDLVNYVLSCNDLNPGVQVLPEEQKNDFKKFLDKKIDKNGSIHISKSSGTFISKKQMMKL